MEQLTHRPAHRRLLASLGLFAPVIFSFAVVPGVAVAQPAVQVATPSAAVATAQGCTRLGPDSTITVTGTFRIMNAGCAPGGWRKVSGPTRLDLTDGEYVESRGRGSSCTEDGVRGTAKPDGSSYCGPAWETRSDPAPGW